MALLGLFRLVLQVISGGFMLVGVFGTVGVNSGRKVRRAAGSLHRPNNAPLRTTPRPGIRAVA
jgi:hypothetical protein